MRYLEGRGEREGRWGGMGVEGGWGMEERGREGRDGGRGEGGREEMEGRKSWRE